jgi:hypothetical protein
MAKNSIRDYANAAASNTDVQGQNIDEGCSPAGINNAIREVMADLADVNDGTISLVSPDFDAATINSVAIDAFPSGTKMLFQQTAAPTGWTKSTAHNDKALRIVSGSVSSGGTNTFSTAFASYTPAGSVSVTVAGHQLDINEIPSHSHDIGVAGTATSSTRNRIAYTNRTEETFISTETSGGGAEHTHAGSTGSFTGTASSQFEVQYVDVIIATKD